MGAIAHDVGHPGFNNDYFVKTRHPLAIRYNDNSVLESMHASVAFELMLNTPNANFLRKTETSTYEVIRKNVIAVILATDMKIHFELVQQVNALGQSQEPPDDKAKDLVLRCLVHAGDLSNPVLPTELYCQWAYRVVLEFHHQAEMEKKRGVPFQPFMEHHPDNTLELAKLQCGFVSFVVQPFWNAMVGVLPHVQTRVDQLGVNLKYWQAIKAEEEEKAKKVAEAGQ